MKDALGHGHLPVKVTVQPNEYEEDGADDKGSAQPFGDTVPKGNLFGCTVGGREVKDLGYNDADIAEEEGRSDPREESPDEFSRVSLEQQCTMGTNLPFIGCMRLSEKTAKEQKGMRQLTQMISCDTC